MPAGDYSLIFSFIGYKSINEDIALKENIKLSKELEYAKTEIKAVEISASTNETPLSVAPMSALKLSPKELAQLPGFVGDIDIIKSLQSVPGIKTYGDGFNKTELDKVLKEKGCNTVFLCGLSAVGCVLATWIGAQDHDYNAYMIKNAIMSHNSVYTKQVEDMFDAVSYDIVKLLLETSDKK